MSDALTGRQPRSPRSAVTRPSPARIGRHLRKNRAELRSPADRPGLRCAGMHPIDGGFRFVPPTPRRTLVARERLVALLRERFSRRIVTVVAPAGFGKTTLLAQAIADNAGATGSVDVWFGCTSDDDAASTLTDGLCRAMGIEPQPSPVAAVEALAEAIWHQAPAQVAVVVDDVHLIAPDSAGAGVIASLVAALPQNGHLVLAGRSPPPVPLARLEVAGDVARLGEARPVVLVRRARRVRVPAGRPVRTARGLRRLACPGRGVSDGCPGHRRCLPLGGGARPPPRRPAARPRPDRAR